jgi:hypothetical protein
MRDRQKIESILTRRFPGATLNQVAAAANAIMGLGEEWEEIVSLEDEPGVEQPVECRDVCCRLARDLEGGGDVRVFKRRSM